MSAIHIMEYIIGLGMFGLTFWLLDGIQEIIQDVSESGDVYNIMMLCWGGSVVIYLIFGGLWVVRRYNEPMGGTKL